MKRLLIFLFLLFTIQGYSQMLLVNGFKHTSPPANVSILATNTNTATPGNSVTNTLSSVPAGSLLVVTFASAQDNVDAPNGTVSSSPSLTWTKQVE